MPSPDEARNSETELKFEVAPGALGKLRKHPALAAPATTSRLRSVYYDTPDHDLRNAGVSLRVRESGGRFVQTVKTREGPGSIERGEWERDVDGARPEASALAGTPAEAVLNGHGAGDLAEVFSTTVERAVRLWSDGSALVELSLDEGRIDAGGDREPIHELELELKAGGAAALFVLARTLAGAAPIRLSFDSKAERGYRLAGHDTTAALKAEQAALSAGTCAADAFRRIARSCLTQVAGNARLLRRVRSPQALHQARVGLRRLRAAMSAFEPLVGDDRFAALKGEAKWLAGELDQARDLDVFIHTAMPSDEEELQPDHALAAFGKRLLAAQARAYDRAVAAIESQRFADLLLDVAAWVEVGAWTLDPDPGRTALRAAPIGAFGAEALDRLHAKVKKAGKRFAHLDAAGRHRLRIKAKKLRYAADFFGEAFPDHPGRRRKFGAGLKALQDQLGALNDIAVAAELAIEVAGKRSGEAAFAAGVLIGARRREEPVLIASAGKAFAAFAESPHFWGRSRI
ncbi:MAG TPA: CHAD domain-containing protein [Caulobacteraceae bacterium]|jgi:inorganic triphosphatase YgiF|nr:CHAD domain-containing protein [Caulobacteraceae bacterium]